jgi:hypothetical protein
MLFILDPKDKDVLVPPYVENELVAASDTCMSMAVQPEVDGDVEVSMTIGGATPGGLLRAATGRIRTSHGTLAIIASAYDPLIECVVPAGRISLSIWVDDPKFPTKVLVKIEPARPKPSLVKS